MYIIYDLLSNYRTISNCQNIESFPDFYFNNRNCGIIVVSIIVVLRRIFFSRGM